MRKGIGEIIMRKDKSLFKNSLYYILYRIINVIYPLITATYVSRILGPEGVGQVSVAQTFVIFLTACACLGLPNYGTREVSKLNSQSATDKLFSELFIINVISSVVFASLYYVVALLPIQIDKTLYYIEGLILVFNIINVDWFYQGLEEFRYITFRSFVVKFISIFLIFAFVRERQDVNAYAMIFSLAYVGNYLFNLIHLRKFITFKRRGLSISTHIKPVLILAITYISNEVYVTSDTVMLGIMTGDAEAGYYSNAMKLVKILTNVCAAMGVALLPRLSRIRSENNFSRYLNTIQKAFKLLFWFTIACVAGISCVSDDLMEVLFGAEFLPSAPILRILCFLVLFRSFSSLFLQIGLRENEDSGTSKIYFSGMVLNILINVLLIPRFGGSGAAFASALCELLICFGLYRTMVKGHFKLEIPFAFWIKTIASLGIMIVCVLTVQNLCDDGAFLRLTVSILVGVISFGLSSLILKNDAVYFLLNKGKEFLCLKGHNR